MKKYIFQADVVRTLAIIGVIGVHIVTTITARPDFFGGKLWWATFLLNCLFRISVPLFVMLSGYLSLGKQIDISQNTRKVFQRIVFPLLVYYAIYHVIYARIAWLRHEPYDYWGIFHNLSKNTYTILYFLVILTFIQLLNPLWNLLTEAKNHPILKYVCGFFLTLGATAYVFYYLSLREGEVFSTFTLWIMWVGYYLFGYLVKANTNKLTRNETIQSVSIFSIGYVITVGLGYLMLKLHHQGVNDLFYIGGQTYADTYLSISVMMMSLSGFNLLMRSEWLEKLQSITLLKKVVMFFAALSFGMYLNHLVVIDVLNKFYGIAPDSKTMPSLGVYLALSTVLTFAITIPLVAVLRKIPLINRIIGEK
jgi:surface polysaccharide O-acyltransferase-like enzyme